MSTEQPSVFRTVAKSRVANPKIAKGHTEFYADSAAKWTGKPYAQPFLPASLSPAPFHTSGFQTEFAFYLDPFALCKR